MTESDREAELQNEVERLEARVYELEYELAQNRVAGQQLRIKDAAIESAMTGIILANEDELIAYANPSFLELWGFSDASDVLGCNPAELLWSEQQLHRGGFSLEEVCNSMRELEAVKRDGTCFDVLMKVTLVKDTDGTPLCYQAAFDDVSRRNQIEEALVRAKNSAEAASRTKSLFLANMSHELRTPMNGIIGFLSLLRGEELTPKQSEFVDFIRKSADALLAVINSILEFSKLEAGGTVLVNEPFDLEACVESCVAPLRAQAEDKGLAFEVEVSASVPRQLIGDKQALGQVLVHLLNNAVKFTLKGGVKLSIHVVNLSDEYAQLVCSVKDTGIGIDPNHQERVLQPFQQGDLSSTRRYGGTGLGLTISRNLCEKLGGKLSFQSVLGEGSTFTFTVLMRKPREVSVRSGGMEPELHETGEGKAAYEESGPVNILVAEDDVTNQLVIEMMLKSLGYECDIVGDGEQALSALEARRYDLMLLDIQMPVMDGLTAMRKIQTRGLRSQVGYVAALTAHALPKDKRDCLDAGMDEVLVKPVEPEHLRSLIRRARGNSVSADAAGG
jgi:PAS domain S-box-containing protein